MQEHNPVAKVKQAVKDNPKAVQAAVGVAHSAWLTPVYNAIRVGYLARQKGIPCPPLTQGMGATAAQMTTRLGLRLGGFPYITDYINQRYKAGEPVTIGSITLTKEQAMFYGSWGYFVLSDVANANERAAVHTSNRKPTDPTFAASLSRSYHEKGMTGAFRFATNGMLTTVGSRQSLYWLTVLEVSERAKAQAKELGYSDTQAASAGIVAGAAAGTVVNAAQTPSSLVQRECQGPDNFPPPRPRTALSIVAESVKRSANPLITAYTGWRGRALVTAVSGIATLAGKESQDAVMDWTRGTQSL